MLNVREMIHSTPCSFRDPFPLRPVSLSKKILGRRNQLMGRLAGLLLSAHSQRFLAFRVGERQCNWILEPCTSYHDSFHVSSMYVPILHRRPRCEIQIKKPQHPLASTNIQHTHVWYAARPIMTP